MRVTCRYTGLSFTSSTFSKVRFVGEHPLMNAPLDTLLSRTANWSNGELTVVEQYVLFVALLKSTELVKFNVPIQPRRDVVSRNMERLIKCAAWIGFIRTKTYLPSYVINPENSHLPNLHMWLESLEDAKEAYKNNYWSITQLERLEARNNALERMIKSPNRNEHRFTGVLADWALTASKADVKLDKERLEYWRAIIRARGNELASIPLDDIRDVLDYMELNLDSYKSGIFAREAIFHLRKLVAKKESGDFFGIGFDYDNYQVDLEDALENPFKLLPSDSPQHRHIKQISAEAPTEEPKRDDYATSFEYLKAKAKYNIAQRTRNSIFAAVNTITALNTTQTEDKQSDEESSI